ESAAAHAETWSSADQIRDTNTIQFGQRIGRTTIRNRPKVSGASSGNLAGKVQGRAGPGEYIHHIARHYFWCRNPLDIDYRSGSFDFDCARDIADLEHHVHGRSEAACQHNAFAFDRSKPRQ